VDSGQAGKPPTGFLGLALDREPQADVAAVLARPAQEAQLVEDRRSELDSEQIDDLWRSIALASAPERP
jgi:hypothetical protein